MRTIRLPLFALMTATALAACSQLGTRTGTGPMGVPSPGELQPAGSLPSVGAQSFKDTHIGDDAICDWRAGDRAP